MAEFIANVRAVLDDSALRKLDEIEKNPINVRVDAGSIRGQIESALKGDFRINVVPDLGTMGLGSSVKSMAKTMNTKMRQVVAPSIRDGISMGLNTRGIFDDDLADNLAKNLTNSLDGAVNASIKNVRAVMNNGRLSKVMVDAVDEAGRKITQTTRITSKGKHNVTTSIKQQYEQTAKTVTDANKKMAASIRTGIDTRSTEASLTKLTAKYQKYGQASKEATKAYDALAGKNGLYNKLKNHKSMSDDELVATFDKYEKARKTLDNILNINKTKGDFLADYTKTKSLDGKMATWMSKNTKAAKAYGDEIQSLQQALRNYNLTQAEYDKIQSRFKVIDADAAVKGIKGYSLWDEVKDAGKQMLGFISVYDVIHTAANGFKEMYQAVYDVDTAMTNLKKVTDESDGTYSAFLERSTTSAQDLGRTVSSLVEQTATWSKLGYSLPEAEELSKLSSIYANVAEVDDATAVSDIVTALKAYNMETSEAARVVDSLNELGNNFATDAAALGQGLSKSASSMNLAGADLYETLAMITGIAEITQDASGAGNALKISSMRIRGMKGELEELGEEVDPTLDSISKVQTQILNLTSGKVNIFDSDGEFRNYYDIMKDIASVYDTMTSTDQATLSEILFGKNRGNQGAALIQAFQSGQIEKAYQTAVNSMGSAEAEQAAWMESLEAKTQQFQAAWQGLSQSVLSSDFLKTSVDAGTGFLNVLTGIVDQVGILGPMVAGGGAFAFFKNLDSLSNTWNKSKISPLIKGLSELDSFKNLDKSKKVDKLFDILSKTDKLKGLSKDTLGKALKDVDLDNVDDVADAIANLSDPKLWDRVKSGASQLWSSIKPMIPGIATWGAVIAAVAVPAMIGYSNTFGQLSKEAEKSRDELTQTANEIGSMQSKIAANKEQLKSLTDTDESVAANSATIKDLNRQNAVLESQIALMQEQYDLQKSKAAQDAIKALTMPQQYQTGVSLMNGELTPTYEYKDIVSKTADDIARLQDLKDQQLELDPTEDAQKMADLEMEITSLTNTILENKMAISDLYTSLFDPLTGDVIEGNELLAERIESIIPSLTGDGEALSSDMQAISDTYSKFVNSANLDSETAEGLIAKFDTWLKGLSEQDEALVKELSLNTDSATWSLQDWQTKFFEAKGTIETDGSIDLPDIETETSGLDKVKSALEENQSATGLTAASVDALTKRYAELENFRPGELFYNTASGIRMNSAYLQSLEKEYEDIRKLDIAKQFEDYYDQLKDINDEIDKHGDGPLKDDLKATRDEILDNIDALKDLETEYEGLINAYADWVNAMNSAQPNDWYDSAKTGLESLDELYKNGLFGNTELQEGLEFFTGKEIASLENYKDRMVAIQEAYAQLDQAIANSGRSLRDMMAGGQEGAQAYLEVLEALGMATFNKDDQSWELEFDISKAAEAMGTTEEFIEMMNGLLRAYNFDINTEEAKLSAEELRAELLLLKSLIDSIKNSDIDLNTNADKLREQLEKLKDLVNQVNGSDMSNGEKENALSDLYEQAQDIYSMLNHKDFMDLSESDVADGYGEALSSLQKYQDALNDVDAAETVFGSSSSQAKEASKELDAAAADVADSLEGLSEQGLQGIGIEIDSGAAESVASQIESQMPEVSFPVAPSAESSPESDTPQETQGIVQYTPDYSSITTAPDVPGTATYTADFSGIGSPPALSGTVSYSASFSGIGGFGGFGGGGGSSANGTAHASGTANANGTANAHGDWGTARGGKTLVGELGQEIVVDPHSGTWHTVGDNGAEFVDIPKNAIVFNHLQSKSLLNNGYVTGRGKALAAGNALPGGTVTGGGRLPGYTPSYSSSGSSNYDGGGDDEEEEKPDKMDWIEIAISRIEEAIDRIAIAAESAFKNLTTRTNATADQIALLNEQISVEQRAANRYLQEANSVGLSGDLAALVRNGAVDISQYDEDTQEDIDEYRDWYEKYIEETDKILELHEDIAELYQDQFDAIQDNFESQLDILDHLTTSYENAMDILEEKGYAETTSYYKAMQEVEQDSLAVMQEELAELNKAFNDAIASGEIQEGSEAWYEMATSINDVKEEIDEATLSIIEYGKAIQEIEWERFDFIRDRISKITDESDFLIDLMEKGKLFDDNGQFTDEGTATIGLHAMNYNVYMAEADEYAKEMEKINKELSNDPYNRDLLERRDELLELQRESILAAEEEKEAIVDLVEEGIDLELDALDDLIEKYKDALDNAKDLFDYSNEIDEQVSNISVLKKQLLAYTGDTSEEGKAKIQQLQDELKEAEKDLEETEYDQYITDQKKLLDELYTEYELILNQRLDNVDALLEEMIETVNANSGAISDTLHEVGNNVGYTLTESMKSIWGDSVTAIDGVISKYGDDLGVKLTTINETLGAIKTYTDRMNAKLDEEARIAAEQKAAEEARIAAERKAAEEAARRAETYYDDSSNYYSGGGSGGSSSGGGSSKKTTTTVVVEEKSSSRFSRAEINESTFGSSILTYESNRVLKSFDTGGLADFTGLAQLDGTPQKPELVLNATDTRNFIQLKDVLRDLSNDNSSILSHAPSPIMSTGRMRNIVDISGLVSAAGNYQNGYLTNATNTFGDIIIEIDHVEDYDDFVTKLRDDKKFEDMVQAMTIGRINGNSRLAKNQIRWS